MSTTYIPRKDRNPRQRECSGCRETFFAINKRGRDPRYCDSCKHRARRLWDKFKIRLEEWNKVLEFQGGGCAICGRKWEMGGLRNLAVDHCHESGQIRGILCFNCNIAVGHLGDNPELVRRAAEYLENPTVQAAPSGAPVKSAPQGHS